MPGDGATLDLWEALATVGANDLGAVRAVEPHLDAIGILAEAGAGSRVPAIGAPGEPGFRSWGVFAAEGGDDPLLARPDGVRWSITGTKPWCSLADTLDAALVTAADETGQRHLFAVSLRDPGIRVLPDQWMARGLSEVPSGPVHFDSVAAEPIGEPGWYLSRPGFAWGGIGVAACWYGGAVGIARTVHAAAARRPNPHLLAHLGAIDATLQSARRALYEAAQLIDGGADVSVEIDGSVLALRVRATVTEAVDEVIRRAGRALGPAPLALDAAHAKRVADLQLYVRQHHAERDQEALGQAVADGDAPW